MKASFAVVTPSLNGGRFIERAVDSVLAQGGVDIDYVVVDGGSTDDTLARLERYDSRVRVMEVSGRGQSRAINHGVAAAKGEFVGILNVDDWYLPGALAAAAEAFERHPSAAVVYGNADLVDEHGHTIGRYPTEAFSRRELAERCIVCQPAAFVRRSAFECLGGASERADFVADYEMWIRLSESHELAMFEKTVAASRVHDGNKSTANRKSVLRQAIAAVRRSYGYVPYSWTFAYASLLVNGDDRQPGRRAALSVPLSLALGCGLNVSSVPRALADWLRHRSFGRHARAR